MIFVIENNAYAISTPIDEQYANEKCQIVLMVTDLKGLE